MNNNNTPRVQSFAATDKGRRPNNEDYVTSFEPTDLKERQQSGYIYIVADGVGGAAIGERASKFAAEKVVYEYLQHPEIEPAIRLKQAIIKANREIFEYAEQNNIRMATTMTVAVIIGNSLIVANVGDSRVYLIRRNEVKQITDDHNIVGELVRNGAMTEAEALKSKSKNKLTRSIGGNDEVQADTFEILLQPDDRILLCSDGLTRYALKEDIAKIAAGASPKQIVNDAIEFAKKRGHGGADNISVITVAYEPVEQQMAPTKPEEEWEIRETEINNGYQKPILYYKFLVVTILLVGLIGIVGVVYFYSGQILAFMQFQSSTPSATTLPETSTTLPSYTSLPTSTESLTSTATPLIMTAEPTHIQAPTSLPDLATHTSVLPVDCLYTVVKKDTLSDIADRFGIGGNNYKKIICASVPGNDSCNVQSPKSIQPGWIVVIPSVNQTICVQNRGTIQ